MSLIGCRSLSLLSGVFALAVGAAAAESHTAKGMTVELVADAPVVVPGRPLHLGVVFRPELGFHTYWRQPGLVGLTPTIEWSLPAGMEAGGLLWPEPQRGKMGAYAVWCLRREVAVAAPITVPATLDPSVTPQVTVRAKVVWMACSRTCHPGTAELSLTLPVRAMPDDATPDDATPDDVVREAAGRGASLIRTTLREQPITDDRWKFAAVRHGKEGGYSLTITPPQGGAVPEDAYFYGHQRLVDSNVEPVRVALDDGVVRIDLAPVEEPDPTPATLIGELWSAKGWGGGKSQRLLKVKATLTIADEPK